MKALSVLISLTIVLQSDQIWGRILVQFTTGIQSCFCDGANWRKCSDGRVPFCTDMDYIFTLSFISNSQPINTARIGRHIWMCG